VTDVHGQRRHADEENRGKGYENKYLSGFITPQYSPLFLSLQFPLQLIAPL
jgi:hypothetical protein